MRSRIIDHGAPFLLATLFAAAASAQVPSWQAPGMASPGGARDSDSSQAELRRDQWMLTVEGVTHAPVDMGVQLGLQTPQRLRLSGGYGWVPGGYMSLLTGVAASASDSAYSEALLERAEYDGHTWRAQVGVQPFRSIGLYADVGYARLTAKGALDLAASGVPALAELGGGYRATTKLDMWLVELGYQGQIADRLLLALALGAMGTFESTTTIASVDGAPSSPLLDDAATEADSALESYGIVPTLTLRVGFDLI